MGKSKQRLFNRCRTQRHAFRMSRTQAVDTATRKLDYNPCSASARNLISLFGLSPEELLENGVRYEVLKSINSLIM